MGLPTHGAVNAPTGFFLKKVPDRRSYQIRLTHAGREMLAELTAQADEHGDRVFAPLTAQERARLHLLLEKLASGLDDGAADRP